MKRIRILGRIFKKAGHGFVDDNAFKLSASLSYYTVFALSPLIIIVISLAGIVYERTTVQDEIYSQLNGLVGAEAALQVQDIIKNLQRTHHTRLGAIIGAILLFIGATGVFTEMQDSINYIWSVKAKPKKGWLKFILNRLLSFSLVVGMSFVLLVSLVLNALLNLLSERLLRQFPDNSVEWIRLVNMGIMLLAITLLFTVIYKVLPDAIISWRDALMGASFTAVLFLLGKFLIGYYLGKSDLGLTYGTAASIVIILIWVYYSALILYFGAEFTKNYALQAGSGIRPKDTAVFVIKHETREIPESHLDT